MEATVVDLRRKMRAVLAAVDRGETVTITYRGKVKAKLVPAGRERGPETPITEDPAFGMWKDRKDMEDPSAWVRELRSRRRHAVRQ